MYDLRAEHKFGEDRSAPVPRDSFQPLQLGHHVVEYHPPITQQQQQCLLPIAVTAIFVVIFFPLNPHQGLSMKPLSLTGQTAVPRFGDKALKIQAVCPQNRAAVLL